MLQDRLQYVEQRRIIMKVHAPKEDHDTTRDVVLAEDKNTLTETSLKSAIENCRYRPK